MATRSTSTPVHLNGSAAAAWPNETWLILFVGAMLYGLLCWPAIEHGGRTRLDPLWSAMPWLWLVPLLIYEIVDARPLRAKLWLIFAYSFATAFFFSGTIDSSIPRFVSLQGMALAALVFVGPFHMLIAFAVLWITRFLWRLLHAAVAKLNVSGWGGKWVAISLVAGLAIAFPVIYRHHAYAMAAQAAIDAADEGWQKGYAFHYGEYSGQRAQLDGRTVEHFVDPETGLAVVTRFWPLWSLVDYRRIYNDRLRELIAEHGLPHWSLKTHVVVDEDLVSMFNSSDLPEIKTFPHRVTADVEVREHDGTFDIEMRRPDEFDMTDTSDAEYWFRRTEGTLFIGRHAKYPQVVFLRRGKDWVGAFHESGILLSAAYRSEMPQEIGRP
jgi:hypothetical protein